MIGLTLQTLDGKRLPITVDENSIIEDVKKQVFYEHGIYEPIKVFYNQEELETSYSLSYYGIENSATLKLSIEEEKTIDIVVETVVLGKISLSVDNTITIKEVRRELKTQHKLGVIAELEKIRLEDGSLIEDENLPLHYLGISAGSQLELTSGDLIRLRGICTYSRERYSMFEETSVIAIKSSDSIDTMKKKFVERLDIEVEVPNTDPQKFVPWHIDYIALFLKRGDTYLELAPGESRTVEDYKLKPFDIIYVLPYKSGREYISPKYQSRDVMIIGISGFSSKKAGGRYFMLAFKLAVQDQLNIPVRDQIITEGNRTAENLNVLYKDSKYFLTLKSKEESD